MGMWPDALDENEIATTIKNMKKEKQKITTATTASNIEKTNKEKT